MSHIPLDLKAKPGETWQVILIHVRRPGTAILFALTIVELLCGRDKRNKVAGPMMIAGIL